MKEGDEITIQATYGESLCDTCKHQEKTFNDKPCTDCDIMNILYEPQEESKS